MLYSIVRKNRVIMKKYLTHIGPVVNPFSARVQVIIDNRDITLKEVFFFTRSEDSEVYILRSADSELNEKEVTYTIEQVKGHKHLIALSSPIEIGEGSLWIDEDKNPYFKSSAHSLFQKLEVASP